MVECNNNTKGIILVLVLGLIIILTLGFGIYGAVEYSNRNKYEDSSYQCGTFGNMSFLSMRKVLLSQWHWKYEAYPQGEKFGYFVQRCPTFTHDVNVYQDNSLTLRTDGKIFTTVSKVNFNDCHGNMRYYMETGSFWQTIINTNKIWVSLLLYHANGTLVAYVDSKIFVVGNIDFKDPSGRIIAAHVKKEIESIRWQWDYTIYDTNKINMDVLVAITGKVSFSPQGHNNKDDTDVCNNFFITTGILALVLLCLLVVGGFCYLYYYYCKKVSNSYSSNHMNYGTSSQYGLYSSAIV